MSYVYIFHVGNPWLTHGFTVKNNKDTFKFKVIVFNNIISNQLPSRAYFFRCNRQENHSDSYCQGFGHHCYQRYVMDLQNAQCSKVGLSISILPNMQKGGVGTC